MSEPLTNWRKAAAEVLGTFALVFAGCGAVMVGERYPGSVAPGAVPMVFGLVVAAMIYAVGHISGAHFNPAVTLGFAVARHFPWRQVAVYWGAQFSGALLAITALHVLLPSGQSYGATVPAISVLQAVGWETTLSGLLMFVIIAVATDTRAAGVMAGIAIGATVTLAAIVGGPVTGASMNPARSLAPALFEGKTDVLWIYFCAPCLGAAIAAKLYESLRGAIPAGDADKQNAPGGG